MACSRCLLLLIGVISIYLPEAHTRAVDFWCNVHVRQKMLERIDSRAGGGCSDVLPSPVQLPCVGINVAEWRNKTLQQKHAEVLEALQLFQHGVQHVRNQTSLKCLERLERSITDHVNIVSNVLVQNDDLIYPHQPAEMCPNKTSPSEVVTAYKRLLNGKLNRLAMDLKHTVCKAK
ncbi:thrombopoietin-like isoform 1-T1 [Menidia menidia]